ncbi:MAG: O-antigen translocase [Flavobacterium sp.]|nr:MAG: O-antigen translocase [Flavobacterium sp.]
MKFLRQNKLYKVLSLNSFSVGANLVLGIFSTKIISFFLGTAGIALLGSFRNFTTMLRSLATLGINNSIIRLFVENKDDKEELSALYATFFWIFLALSSFLGILVFVLAEPISHFLFSASYLLPIRIFALLLPFTVLNAFWLAIYNGLEMFRQIIIIQILSNIAAFVLTVVFVWNGNVSLGLLSIAFAEAAMIAVTFLFVKSQGEHFKFRLERVVKKKHLAVIGNFSVMALVSAIIVPLTLILIRNRIISTISITDAGIWDGVNRLSGFYMVFFNTGLSLYYMPKLSSLNTVSGFRKELKTYFQTLVPLFVVMLAVVFIFRSYIVGGAFTSEFAPIKEILIWQLAGDFFRIMSLAFGYQIVVKTMMKEYFIGEIAFNGAYLAGAIWLMPLKGVEGAVQAYFYANILTFFIILVIFRNVIFRKKTSIQST